MSVDIAWDAFTAGADGAALSEQIRAFVHAKFQQITLPRFISAVHVQSFEFGSISPDIEIKDICDPLPDFYEDDELSESTDSEVGDAGIRHAADSGQPTPQQLSEVLQEVTHQSATKDPRPTRADPPGSIAADHDGSRLRYDTRSDRPGSTDRHGRVLFPRSGTPGIPGGTSNLNYFHLPGGGFSGAQTPLAAVASGTPFSPGPWPQDLSHRVAAAAAQDNHNQPHGQHSRPGTAGSISSPEIGSPFDPSSPQAQPVGWPAVEKVSDDLTLENLSLSPTQQDQQVSPSDLQIVGRVTYDGDVRMTLTAEILLDYPMPSFVGIPLRLSVTGMKFDGVAIIAYIKKRVHFCFLDPTDAQTLVGDEVTWQETTPGKAQASTTSSFGGLLREIQIQSEIGKQESGKQILKNVGKVEAFVMEQVRKIFEDEFVFPSFWTFLV